MHYKDGSEAKVGDVCLFKHGGYLSSKWVPHMREGIVVSITPGCDTCNANVAYLFPEVCSGVHFLTTHVTTVTLGECEKGEVPIGSPSAT